MFNLHSLVFDILPCSGLTANAARSLPFTHARGEHRHDHAPHGTAHQTDNPPHLPVSPLDPNGHAKYQTYHHALLHNKQSHKFTLIHNYEKDFIKCLNKGTTKRQYGINGNNNFNFIKHTAMLHLVKYVPDALT